MFWMIIHNSTINYNQHFAAVTVTTKERGKYMKAIIFSDSHGDVEVMRNAVNKETPGVIIHLGDCVSDAGALKREFPNIPMYGVAGNRDGGSNENYVNRMELCGKNIMLTHGHIYKVKSGTVELLRAGTENDADIILFGHTHEPFLRRRNGKWMMNPGRVGRISGNSANATYGILDIEPDFIRWELRSC